MRPSKKVFVIVYRITNGLLELLALKPNPEPNRNADYYVVTGGVEAGETFENAAIREAKEEIGVEPVNVLNLRNVISYKDHINFRKYDEHCYGVKINNELIQLNEEHIGYKWLEEADFINTIWWDYDKNILIGMIERIRKQEHINT